MSLALFSLPRSQQRQWLEQRLSRAVLPAAKRMGDGFRLPGREGRATPAAVLIPVVNRIDGLTLLLTERSANLPDHPGQISFPGGAQSLATSPLLTLPYARPERKWVSWPSRLRSWANSPLMRR